MRILFSILSLLFCMSTSEAGELPRGFAAVGKEKLDGSKLVLQNAGCSLSAPNADWIWIAPAKSADKAFMCFSNKTGAGITVSVGEMANDMDDHTKDELM